MWHGPKSCFERARLMPPSPACRRDGRLPSVCLRVQRKRFTIHVWALVHSRREPLQAKRTRIVANALLPCCQHSFHVAGGSPIIRPTFCVGITALERISLFGELPVWLWSVVGFWLGISGFWSTRGRFGDGDSLFYARLSRSPPDPRGGIVVCDFFCDTFFFDLRISRSNRPLRRLSILHVYCG